MPNIVVAVNAESVLDQIAYLINSHNFLTAKYDGLGLAHSSTQYHVILYGNIVAACAGIEKKEDIASVIKHVCVEPIHRRKGYAAQVVMSAIKKATTPFVYCYVREENLESLQLFKKLDFVKVRIEKGAQGNLILLGRRSK